MIISISGLDGSGKTVVSKGLVTQLKSLGVKVKYFHVDSYFLVSPFAAGLRRLSKIINKEEKDNPLLSTGPKSPMQKLWVLVAVFDNYINFLRFRVLSLMGFVVVCDRYFYDRLVGFGYYGYSDKVLWNLFLKLTPRADVTIFLEVASSDAKGRENRGQHSEEFFKKMGRGYRKLFSTVANLTINMSKASVPAALDTVIAKVIKKRSRGVSAGEFARRLIPLIGALAVVLLMVLGGQKLFSIKAFSSDIESLEAHSLFVGEMSLFDAPGSSGNYTAGTITGKKDVESVMAFSQPISLSGFYMFFPGDLHRASAYIPKEFDVYYQTKSNLWLKVDEIRNNRQSHYLLSLPDNVTVRAFKIVLKSAALDNTVVVNDLKFFVKEKVGLGSVVNSFWLINRRSLWGRLTYASVLYLFLLIPGFAAIQAYSERKKIKIGTSEKMIYGPALATFLLGVLGIAHFKIGGPLFLNFYLLVFLIALMFLLQRGFFKEIFRQKTLLLIFFIAVMIISLLQGYRESLFNLPYIERYLETLDHMPLKGYFGYHTDNTLPWGTARAFLHRVSVFSDEASSLRLGQDVSAVFDRPPLLAFTLVPVLKFFGEGHFEYQQFMNVLATLYYLGAFLLVKTLFNKRTAKIVVLLLLLNEHITYQINNVEIFNKFFATYIAFLAVNLFASRPKSRLLIGLLLMLGFLVHPMTVFFVAIFGVAYLYKYKITSTFVKNSLITFIPVLLAFGAFMYYVNVVVGEDNLYVTQLSNRTEDFLRVRFVNSINLLVPDIGGRGYNEEIDTRTFLQYSKAVFLRRSLVSAISPFLFFAGILLVSKELLKKYAIPLIFGLGVPLLFIFTLNTYSLGGYVSLYPFALPLIFGFIVIALLEIKRESRILLYFFHILYVTYLIYRISWVVNEMNYFSLSTLGYFIGLLISVIGLGYYLLHVVNLGDRKIN